MAKKKMCERYEYCRKIFYPIKDFHGIPQLKSCDNTNSRCELIPSKKERVVKRKVWVDLGSHGKPFVFMIGPVADRYPDLLHIFASNSYTGLTAATLTYKLPKGVK